MLVSNETAKEFELQFWRADAAGRETQYYTITLGNALLVSIDLEMPNNKHPDLATLETFEVVTFTYQRVEWTWADGGLVAVADREIA
jgi:type VI secretion system secreted protein Hcp